MLLKCEIFGALSETVKTPEIFDPLLKQYIGAQQYAQIHQSKVKHNSCFSENHQN